MRASFRAREPAEALMIPSMEMDDRLKTADSNQWTLREALLFSFYWGFPTHSAENFINFKLDCHITEVLSNPENTLFVKQTEAKQFLGTVFSFTCRSLVFSIFYHQNRIV